MKPVFFLLGVCVSVSIRNHQNKLLILILVLVTVCNSCTKKNKVWFDKRKIYTRTFDQMNHLLLVHRTLILWHGWFSVEIIAVQCR